MRPVRAFTLIEVILALSLVVFLMAAVLAFYHNAMGLRRNVMADVSVTTAHRAIMEHLTDELRAAAVAPAWGLSLQGQTDSISFVSAGLPAAWALAPQDPSATVPPPADQDLKLIAYHLRVETDDQGNPLIDGVERSVQRVLAPIAPVEGQQLSTTLIGPPIKYLHFRYYDGTQWATTWASPGIPVAVEINLGLDPLPDNTDPDQYASPVFRRVVYIPGNGNLGNPSLGLQTTNSTPIDTDDNGTGDTTGSTTPGGPAGGAGVPGVPGVPGAPGAGPAGGAP